ncbi:FAD/NAD(P)-binding domain-containing protein [Lentinus brumalis]|uniref:FAD/NAD(P)-binding domain-containing protein n=1 Tax=Lentinus brumalis TaxID=2498619 RepID=A0A371DNU6_9APHY|nr:FAD/NAD(P)-binding domain-containing protein [Polyporus brumalis]
MELTVRTGENIGFLPWTPAVMAETGGELLMIHHDDLMRLLHKLATDAGAKVDINAPVQSIHAGISDSKPSITLLDGEELRADLLIGADGSNSIVRNVVLGEANRAKPGGLTVYSGIIDAEKMLSDPELRPLVLTDDWPIWTGPRRSCIGHPVRGDKREYAIGVYSWTDPDGQDGQENWEESVPTEAAVTEIDAPMLRRLLKLTPRLVRTKYMARDQDDWTWVDRTGRIVLLGDAAHPSYGLQAGGMHTTGMAVEDAVVLGCLLSNLQSMDQLPTLMDAYQELRQRRCALVGLADLGNAQMMALPPGPEADARDEDMRRQRNEWDEGMLKAQFEEISGIFLYDAGDAAEEWWINWGRFHKNVHGEPSVVDVEVHCDRG